MLRAQFENYVEAAIDDYLLATEAFDDAVIAVDPATHQVDIMEEEYADDNLDIYDVMDFIEMDPNGIWRRDQEAIKLLADDYFE